MFLFFALMKRGKVDECNCGVFEGWNSVEELKEVLILLAVFALCASNEKCEKEGCFVRIVELPVKPPNNWS